MKENIEVLISSEKLQERIKEIAKEIRNDYKDEEVVFVSVLKGAVFFTVDLMKNYSGDAIIDVVRVSSIVEDIVDTGRTFSYLVDYIGKMNPKSIKTCVMLDKPSRRVVDFNCDYVGFKIDDLFVIGYGLDYDEKYRNLPYIGYVKK